MDASRRFLQLLLATGFWTFSVAGKAASVHETFLKGVVVEVANPNRNWRDTAELHRTADWIHGKFVGFGLSCRDQLFEVEHRTYRNVECVLPGRRTEVVVLGAHYDVAGKLPGADDNASGVAGILDVARRFHESGDQPNSTLRFVAYALEEPPFYGTESMGSFFHARKMKDSGIAVKLMVSLEMLGCYGDSIPQAYPEGVDARSLPKFGNFYAAVSNLGSSGLTKAFKAVADRSNVVRTIVYNAPSQVDWSDHMNYWAFGFPAFMITDTAFLRNLEYHKAGDTPETLNYHAMAGILDAIYEYAKGA